MRKAILFPFEINQDNHLKYANTIEFAKKNQLPVVCFTALSRQSTAADLDHIYLHLLELNGFYQTQFNNWERHKKVIIKSVIKKGNYKEQLQLFIKSTAMELVFV